MITTLASGPSGGAVGLIVGTGTVTVAAIWSVLGYFARRFLSQQTSNHRDTQEALGAVKIIRDELPRIGWRLTRLEVAALCGAAWLVFTGYRRR